MKRITVLLFLVFFTYALTAEEEETFSTGKKPLRAALTSLVIPGGGQYYNEAYWKAGAVFGIESGIIALTLYHDSKMDDYQNKMNQSTGAAYNYYRGRKEHYYNKKQNDYWWFGTTLLLSSMDAFVDAHLYNFEQKKKAVHIKFEDKVLSLSYEF